MKLCEFLVIFYGSFFSGIELAATNAIIGLILCITIIGIPFGKQFFKIARVALNPLILIRTRSC
ncbi:YccF domain-containing protein [Butyrivibrio sp. MC2021]|uniref:YccF domain-containing protein n=1 Tax=Butyrivibrio sp. MC2021 TaxID=1408306 RepID=UPI0012DC6814